MFVNVAEFLREDPLEAEMRSAVAAALRSVAGVTEVAEQDREVWVLSGTPDGEAITHTVGEVVDTLASRARAEIDRQLG